MQDAKERITLVDDYHWDWEVSQPDYNIKTPGVKYGSTRRLDPFPCYHHPIALVEEIVRKVEKSFPIGFPTFYFVFDREYIGRTNGEAFCETSVYRNEELKRKAVWEGVVCLYGKRIPLHPAMTRYLVAHEYGHIVDNWLCHCSDLEQNGLDATYAKMRGIGLNQDYGGKKWHTNIGEIIANDFRICVAGIEAEFWPHECKHPNEDDNVKNWWYEAIICHAQSSPIRVPTGKAFFGGCDGGD